MSYRILDNLRNFIICQVKQKRLQSSMHCHLCWEGCYCRHWAWCWVHIQDGHVGWPNLNTADMTGVSIYCFYLRSVPLPSFGRRKPLSSEEPTTWEWGQDSAVINYRTPSSCFGDWILGEHVVSPVQSFPRTLGKIHSSIEAAKLMAEWEARATGGHECPTERPWLGIEKRQTDRNMTLWLKTWL